MAVIDTTIGLWRAGNYSGSGNWLDEAGSLDWVRTGTTFTAQAGSALAYFSFNGTSDKMLINDAPKLLSPGTGDFTAMLVVRNADMATNRWPTLDRTGGFGPGALGWRMYGGPSGDLVAEVDDGTSEANDQVGSPSNNTITTFAFVVDRTAETIESFMAGTGTGTPGDTTGLGTITGLSNITLGVLGAGFRGGDVFAVAVWAAALSDADVATAGTELQTLIGSPLGFNVTLRNNSLDEITALAGTSAQIILYSGTQPATGGAATTEVATLAGNATAFAAAASSGVLTVNAVTADESATGGTATWGRINSSGGATFVADFTVGTVGTDIVLPTNVIPAGAAVGVSSFTITDGNP